MGRFLSFDEEKHGVYVLYLEVVSLTGTCLAFLVSWRSWLNNRSANRTVRGWPSQCIIAEGTVLLQQFMQMR